MIRGLRRRSRQAARAATLSESLELADVQGNVLRGYRCEATSYIFATIVDPEAARGWLAEISDPDEPWLMTAARQLGLGADCFANDPGLVAINLGLTWTGLRRLGLAPTRLARLPEAFRASMAGRADRLGDRPERWEEPFGAEELHLLLMVSGSQVAVDAQVESLRQGFWQCGLTELAGAIEGHGLPFGAEHFGFRDGISQPRVDLPELGSDTASAKVPLGEFIIGQPNVDGECVEDVPSVTRNGSYLAVRKLRQDVAAFNAMIEGAARCTGLSEELVRAKLIGRWRDGTPVIGNPAHQPPAGDEWPSQLPDNGFDYSGDVAGAQCPIGAHIRRANPRGSLEFDSRLEFRHRLLRRGMPYGPAYTEASAGQERGLVFACYQSDLASQFEFVQSQWLSDGNVFGLGIDLDPLSGQPQTGSGRMQFEGSRGHETTPPLYFDLDTACVSTLGGEYFLVPSLSALANLSRLDGIDSR